MYCQVSRTLEYAYNDFVVAQLAHSLGYTDDYNLLMNHSDSFKMVIDDNGTPHIIY